TGMTAEGSPLPRAVFLSSYAPPHLPPPLQMVDHLDDHQLGMLLSDTGGLPAELTRWPALREKAITAARNDLRLCMTDEEVEEPALSCPTHALSGSDDPLVSEADLHEWHSRTSAEFSVRSSGAATSTSATASSCSPPCDR